MIHTPSEKLHGLYAGTHNVDEAGAETLLLLTGGRGLDAFMVVENPHTGQQRAYRMADLVAQAVAEGLHALPEVAAEPDPSDVLAAHDETDRLLAGENGERLRASVAQFKAGEMNIVDGAAVLEASTESSTPASKRKTPKKGAAT